MSDTTLKYRVFKAVEEKPLEVTFEEVMERVDFLYKVDRKTRHKPLASDTGKSRQRFQPPSF
ncbi:hypothetical protein QUB70_21300, partial [Microcoleus sp. A003_D6]|uniref:hypothetical protein n=1 Tax=Microcoleus sp. A003_D6 TaxID=3055266 RepID=UPI002FCED322